MSRLLKLLLCGVAALWFSGAAAQNNDDGFVWIDANTKIRLKPIGNAAAGATAPEQVRGEPARQAGAEKPKKQKSKDKEKK